MVLAIESVLLLVIGIIAVLAIIAANAYFVAQEFAYMAVDRTRLAADAAAGDAAAERALSVTKRTSFMLSGAQLGITVTGLLVGYVAEPLVGRSIGTLLGGVGIPAEIGIAVGTISTLVGATLIQMIFGELYPKNLAIAHSAHLSRALANSTIVYLAVFGWLISFFDRSANLFLRLIKVEPVHDLDVSASADDLAHIIADSRESGNLPTDLSLMMDRILEFPRQNVEHAMIPRPHVDWVRPDMTLGDMRQLMAEGHTRYPVLDSNENPVGVIELADVLRYLEQGRLDAPVSEAMKDVLIIPEVMPLPMALSLLQRENSRMACAVDEYGSFVGALTVEDIAMEIVGKITDEHDTDVRNSIVAEGLNVWTMDGDVHLDEIARTIGEDLPEVDTETIAGLVIGVHGMLPEKGSTISVALPVDPAEFAMDQVTDRKLVIDILEVERHVPTKLRVRLVEDRNGEYVR